MKTTLMSLTIISLFFSFICCNKQETIEDKIKKEFKIYVNENFGDPNDLKEVVSIDLKDTVSYRPIYEIVSMTKGLYEKGKEQDDSIFYYIEGKGFAKVVNKMTRAEKEKIGTYMKALIDFYEDKQLEYISVGKELDKILAYNDSTMYIHYEIKARVTKGDIKSLDIYHAYIDNNGKIDIKDHIKKMSELPKKWSDIDNDLTRFNAIMKEKLDYQLPFFKLFNTYPSIKENYEKK